MLNQTVRTTVSLPVFLYEEMKVRALKRRKTLSEMIVEELLRKDKVSDEELEKEIERDLAFFAKIAKRGRGFDTAKAVREERDKILS